MRKAGKKSGLFYSTSIKPEIFTNFVFKSGQINLIPVKQHEIQLPVPEYLFISPLHDPDWVYIRGGKHNGKQRDKRGLDFP